MVVNRFFLFSIVLFGSSTEVGSFSFKPKEMLYTKVPISQLLFGILDLPIPSDGLLPVPASQLKNTFVGYVLNCSKAKTGVSSALFLPEIASENLESHF